MMMPSALPSTKLPNALYRAEQVRALDRGILQRDGLTELALMQRAAAAALALLQHCWPSAQHLVVLAGTGNNGGDAWWLAALAQQFGLQVTCYALGAAAPTSAAAQARAQALAAGVVVAEFAGQLPPADVVVDGLLGTGFQGVLRADYAALIAAVNQHSAPVLALDLPSGLQADTGVVADQAIIATATLCFVALKQGMMSADGPDYCGQLYYAALADTPTVPSPSAELIGRAELHQQGRGLPKRLGNTHKGMYGHVLVLGGNRGLGGAVMLSTEAALRSGAGLVSCATQAEHSLALLSRCPCVMVRGVASGLEVAPLVANASVLAVGPGLGQDGWAELLLQQAFGSDLPLVLDADGLNLLAQPQWQRDFAQRSVILTPHPGEAARLLGVSPQDIQRDRFASAKQLAQCYQAIVVLKGQGSIIAAPDGRLAVCQDGNAGMSSGGMGDVLTGVLAALLAQGLDAWQAACWGVCVHSAAADACATTHGPRGMLATDLIAALPAQVN